MTDEENKSLVPKPNLNLATKSKVANNVLSQIASDALEVAKESEPKLLSVGGYDFDETSYKQLKIWSQRIILNGKMGSEIEVIVECIDKCRKSELKKNPRNVTLQNWLFKGTFQTICFLEDVHWLDQTIDLSHTPNLKTLFCPNNQLSELDLSHTPNLKVLWCPNNQLSELDLSHTPNLKNLDWDGNQIIEVDLPESRENEE